MYDYHVERGSLHVIWHCHHHPRHEVMLSSAIPRHDVVFPSHLQGWEVRTPLMTWGRRCIPVMRHPVGVSITWYAYASHGVCYEGWSRALNPRHTPCTCRAGLPLPTMKDGLAYLAVQSFWLWSGILHCMCIAKSGTGGYHSWLSDTMKEPSTTSDLIPYEYCRYS